MLTSSQIRSVRHAYLRGSCITFFTLVPSRYIKTKKLYVITLRLDSPYVPSILYLVYCCIFSRWSDSMTSTSKQHTHRSCGNLHFYHRVLVLSSCALTTISQVQRYYISTRSPPPGLHHLSLWVHHVAAASRTHAFVPPLSPLLPRSAYLISGSTFYSSDL